MDFQKIHNRKQTNAVKWDQLQNVFQTEDVIPMWIADMDFRAPEAVNEAIKKRADHGIYGYNVIDDDTKQIITDWIEKKHRWKIKRDMLVFSPGVITSLHTAIQAFTNPDDKILLQTPVYTPFFNLVTKGNRKLVENPLQYNGERYEIDFNDFEEKVKTGVKAFILCSPHNPVGRVWTKEELMKMADICLKHDVIILSDEIHADLIYAPNNHIPIASLSDEIAQQTITCMSPTKTFNLAGLQASYLAIPNKRHRTIFQDQMGLQGFSQLNTFGIIAMKAAYEHGGNWLEELMKVFSRNKEIARNRLMDETNGKLYVLDSEATYLLWIDCTKLGLSATSLKKFMIKEARVGLNAGAAYGKAGDTFMRMNIACPTEVLEEAIDRIVHAMNRLS